MFDAKRFLSAERGGRGARALGATLRPFGGGTARIARSSRSTTRASRRTRTTGASGGARGTW
jgi:hypothetical protein